MKMKCKKKAALFKVFLLPFSFILFVNGEMITIFTTYLFISVKRGAEDAGEVDKKKPRLEVMTVGFQRVQTLDHLYNHLIWPLYVNIKGN